MECPKCEAEIGSASYCGCGWGRKKKADRGPEMPRVPCAFYSCARLSAARIKVMGNSWSNFCAEHYEEHFLRQAEETCLTLGLKTKEQKYKWVREKLKKGLFKRIPIEPIAEREPGEDREELETYVQA